MTTAAARDVLVLTVQGQTLDRSNTARFKQEIAGHLRPGVKIALDLAQVRCLDGSGCGAVLSAHKQAASLGGEMTVCSLHKPVRALFQKLGLHRRVPTYNRTEEAVRSFQNRI
jgi:anti-anti-sigma factor